MCVPLQISVIWTGIYSSEFLLSIFMQAFLACGTFIGRGGNQLYVLISFIYEYNLFLYCEKLAYTVFLV